MMFRLLSLLILTTCLSEARAEWFVEDVDGTTFATISKIEIGDDAKIPEADIYVVASPGGYTHVAVAIAEKLKGKTVTYAVALSAGAMIVDLTNAIPLSGKAVKGYHWSRPVPNAKIDPEVLAQQQDGVDKYMLISIFNTYKAKYASRIIGLLAELPEGWMVVDIFEGAAPRRMSLNELLAIPLVANAAERFNWRDQ